MQEVDSRTFSTQIGNEISKGLKDENTDIQCNEDSVLTDFANQMKIMSESLVCHSAISMDHLNGLKESVKTKRMPDIFLSKSSKNHWKLEVDKSFSDLSIVNEVSCHRSETTLLEVQVLRKHHDADRKIEEQNPVVVVQQIQKELQALTTLAPSVSALVSALLEKVLHYKECDKCRERFSSSLSLILNRIRELNSYVVLKRRGIRPSPPLEPIRRRPSVIKTEKNPVQKVEKKEESSPSSTQEPERQFVKLEKVEAVAAAEGHPGVQILLFVHSEKQLKKVFGRREQRFLENREPSFPIVIFGERSDAITQVVKPESKLFLEKKQGFFQLKEFASAANLLFLHSSKFPVCLLVFIPEVATFRTVRNKTDFTASLAALENYFKCSHKWTSSRIQNIVANASDGVKELKIKPGIDKKMEFRILMTEVNALKALLAEISRNQLKLSNILLEEGIYSPGLIKLTDPNLLEAEGEMVREIEEIERGFSGNYPVEILQKLVQETKRKSNLKNSLIVLLLKGLRSNAPREWWEEIVHNTFDDTKYSDGFDYDKVEGFIQQFSFFMAQESKAPPRVLPPPTQLDEEIQEEELYTKGNLKADTAESLKKLKPSSGGLGKILESVLKIVPGAPENGPRSEGIPMKKIENQISSLNLENEKIWQEVHHLRSLLSSSIRHINEKRMIQLTNRDSFSDSSSHRASGKTINLTIQIASDATSNRSKDNDSIKMYSEDGHRRGPKTSSTGSYTPREPSTNSTSRRAEPKDRKSSILESRPKFHLKSERRRSQNDLSFLDDFSQAISENGKPTGAFPSEKMFEETSAVQQVLYATPHSSDRDILQLMKPTDHAYLKQSMSESEDSQAGPSRKSVDFEFILQKPSLMKLVESQNADASGIYERELEPILENEDADLNPSACPSGALCQAVRQLKIRMRSINKDVAMLKLRNDRIEKVLDKLLEDTVDNNKCFEEIENNYKSFNQRIV